MLSDSGPYSGLLRAVWEDKMHGLVGGVHEVFSGTTQLRGSRHHGQFGGGMERSSELRKPPWKKSRSCSKMICYCGG